MVERYNVDVEKNENGYWEGVLLVSANGAWVSYSDCADLERQIAELQAERDALQEESAKRGNMYIECNRTAIQLAHRAQAAEAENARLRALPLKDEVERPTHRHKKRGSEYVLLGCGKMQAENWHEHNGLLEQNPSIDMREVAIYRSVDDGSLWARPREEFEDGRFETLALMR